MLIKPLALSALALGMLAAFPGDASAEVVARTVEYNDGDTVLEGVVYTDDSSSAARPGVLVIHQWKGISDHEHGVGRRLAEEGYTVFLADIYGKDVRPQTTQEAGQQAGLYRGNAELFRQRLTLGYEAMLAQPETDTTRTAAIGYCFGGTGALELARSGADLGAVISFHGGLGTTAPADPGAIKAQVLVLHGADDPLVPDDEVTAFFREMREAEADWDFVGYGGAVHSFTDLNAANPGVSEYHEEADAKSWQAMHNMFDRLFGGA